MNKESQVRGCYNFLFAPTRKQCRLTDDLLLQGHWGKEDALLAFSLLLLYVHGSEMAY